MRTIALAAALTGLLLVSALGLGACANRDIPWATLDARYSLPGSHFAELEPGLVVHYTDDGDPGAPALVLVHGLAASVHAWRPWSERLSADYRVIALDLPGHGLTRTPKGYRASMDANVAIVDRLASRLGLAPFTLAGNSMGGAVAWRYAMLHPDRLSALVLVNAAGWPGEGGARGGPPGGGLMNNAVSRTILKTLDPRWVIAGVLRSAYLDDAIATNDLIDQYAEMIRAPGHRDVLLTQSPGPATPVTPADFAAIAAPTLILAGVEDRVIPVEDQRAFAAAIPGARLIEYPQGGHLPMEQLPDDTARDVREFLAGVQSR